MPVMPAWALALMIVMQTAPQIAAMIDLANAPELTPEQMAALMQSRDKAIADYKAVTGQTA